MRAGIEDRRSLCDLRRCSCPPGGWEWKVVMVDLGARGPIRSRFDPGNGRLGQARPTGWIRVARRLLPSSGTTRDAGYGPRSPPIPDPKTEAVPVGSPSRIDHPSGGRRPAPVDPWVASRVRRLGVGGEGDIDLGIGRQFVERAVGGEGEDAQVLRDREVEEIRSFRVPELDGGELTVVL